MRRFELVEGSSAKFWEVQVEGDSVTVRYGRLGTEGQRKTHSLSSAEEAAEKAEKLVQEKVKKGYTEVGATPPAAAATPSAEKAAKPAAGKADKPAAGKSATSLERKLAPFAKVLKAPVPEELRALVAHGLATKRPFFGEVRYGELTLTATPRGADDYLDSSEGDAWAAFFADIAWVAEEADGGLVGYYGKARDRVIYLDNEGSPSITGRTLLEHLAWRVGYGDEDAEHPELDAFAAEAGLPKPSSPAEARDPRPSPRERLDALVASLQTATGPATRPVDRSPSGVALADGRVVVISSEDSVTTRESYDSNVAFSFDPLLTRFRKLPETPFKAYLNAAMPGVLSDGRVPLLALGREETALCFFDPPSESWSRGPTLARNHDGGAALLLPDDRILVVGSRDGNTSVYDASSDSWTSRAPIPTRRGNLGALLLADGRALTVGGMRSDYSSTAACEIYDPTADAWTRAADLPAAELNVALLRLADDRVVAARGNMYAMYDATADSWSPWQTPQGVSDRMLMDRGGRVLFFQQTRVSALDPHTGTVTEVGSTALPRGYGSGAYALPDGRVLLVGGDLYNNVACEPEIWDPATGQGSALPGFEKELEKQRKVAARRRKA